MTNKELIDLIKIKANACGFNYYHMEPYQIYMILDLVRQDLSRLSDKEKLRVYCKLNKLRNIIQRKSSIQRKVQSFMSIYKHEELAKALLNRRIGSETLCLEDFKQAVEIVYKSKDLELVYSMIYQFECIGLITRTRFINDVLTMSKCRGFDAILQYISK